MSNSSASFATWFGPPDASLFGVVNHPVGRHSGTGVVVVPSLGIEQVTTYRGARALAEKLACAGVPTLRYDHPGTGSSTGDQLSGTAWEEWESGVVTAVRWMQDSGVGHVVVIGIRAGALIAASALADADLPNTSLVVWDPPQSGRRFLREQTAKYRLTVGQDPADPGVSTLGGHFSPETAARIRRAKWAPVTRVAILAARPEVIADPQVDAIADDATKMVTVYHDQKPVKTMPTSMGKGGWATYGDVTMHFWTQPGTYTVLDKASSVLMDSTTYGLPLSAGYRTTVAHGVRISNNGIYFHAMPATVWAQGNTNTSHGCLNLSSADAEWYFDQATTGDVVEIKGTGGPDLEQWKNGDWSVPWDVWQTGSPA